MVATEQARSYPPGTGPLYAEIPKQILEALRDAAYKRRTTKTAIVIEALERELADELSAAKENPR